MCSPKKKVNKSLEWRFKRVGSLSGVNDCFDLLVEVVRVALFAIAVFWCHGRVDPALFLGLSQLFTDCFFFGSLGIFASFLFSGLVLGI